MPGAMEQPIATNPQHFRPLMVGEGKAMKPLEQIAMDLCRIRDALRPIAEGEKDAREICVRQIERLKTAANVVIEHEKLYREALELLEEWVKRIRRGDMGD